MKNHIKLFNTNIYLDNTLMRLSDYLKTNFKNESIIIIVDENTVISCLPILKKNCRQLKDALIIQINSGEQNKTIETATYIWNKLASNLIDREAVVINLGGGVICDIGGFCASTYKRGIRFVNVPTTLLAMVDAAVGNKTGVDLNNLKNLIGSFAQPEAVFISTVFLKTMDDRNLKSGFAEMIKHALIADEKLWHKFGEKGFANCLNDLNILKALNIKARIVKKDPFENSVRKILNFGHTAGHAIESYFLLNAGQPLLHGECVAMGMVIESFLSYNLSTLTKSEAKDISEFIDATFVLKKFNTKAVSAIIELMRYDKKNSKTKINFTLLNKTGKAEPDHYCAINLIKEAFAFYNSIAE